MYAPSASSQEKAAPKLPPRIPDGEEGGYALLTDREVTEFKQKLSTMTSEARRLQGIPACKNCRYYTTRKCEHPLNATVDADPINGGPEITFRESPRNFRWRGNPCGPEGRLFEKNTMWDSFWKLKDRLWPMRWMFAFVLATSLAMAPITKGLSMLLFVFFVILFSWITSD